jgi:hypothetical protein
MESQKQELSLGAFLFYSVCALIAIGLFLSGGKSGLSPPSSPPTQREKDEAAGRAYLREFSPKGASEQQIRQGAKAAVDEWDRVTRGR